MILAIDTSTQWMGISIFDGTSVLYEKVWKTNRRHTIELTPAIKQALADTGITPKDLTAVAAAIGPGSFTSLRIGLAAAKGFALSLHIPLFGVPSLDILAGGIPVKDMDLICLLRAGRGRFAAMKYTNTNAEWTQVGEYEAVTAEDVEREITTRTLVCGEMSAEEMKVIARRWRNALLAQPHENIRRPSILAAIAHERFLNDDVDDAASIAPIYLRTVINVDNRTPV